MKYLLILFSVSVMSQTVDELKAEIARKDSTIVWLKKNIDGLYHDNLDLRRDLEESNWQKKKWYVTTGFLATENGTYLPTGVSMTYRKFLFGLKVDPFFANKPIFLLNFGYRIY